MSDPCKVRFRADDTYDGAWCYTHSIPAEACPEEQSEHLRATEEARDWYRQKLEVLREAAHNVVRTQFTLARMPSAAHQDAADSAVDALNTAFEESKKL